MGVYFLIEGTALRDAGGDKVKYFGIWLAGLTCMMGGARFLIADLIVGVKVEDTLMTSPTNCFDCKHHFITHEKSRPYGCRRFGFKGPLLPSRVVFQETGMECAYFHGSQQKKRRGRTGSNGEIDMSTEYNAVQESIKIALDAADAATDVTSEFNKTKREHKKLEASVKNVHRLLHYNFWQFHGCSRGSIIFCRHDLLQDYV